jgi:hypothetical protein
VTHGDGFAILGRSAERDLWLGGALARRSLGAPPAAPPVVSRSLGPPVNLGFDEAAAGGAPAGWQMTNPHAEVAVVDGSVRIRATAGGNTPRLRQTIDATAYRGRRITLSSRMRCEGSAVALYARVARSVGGRTSYRDAVCAPGAWRMVETTADIASDAAAIELGVSLDGEGSAWIDEIAITAR